MAQLSPTQAAWRGRIEAGIRLAEPFLNLVLVVGDRVSRAVDRDEIEAPARRVVETETQAAVGPGRD